MKTIDLKFWKTIEGEKKSHYIFIQENTFFVLTDMDKGYRGNFHAIKLEEVDCIRNQLCSNLIPQTFQSGKYFSCKLYFLKMRSLKVCLFGRILNL